MISRRLSGDHSLAFLTCVGVTGGAALPDELQDVICDIRDLLLRQLAGQSHVGKRYVVSS